MLLRSRRGPSQGVPECLELRGQGRFLCGSCMDDKMQGNNGKPTKEGSVCPPSTLPETVASKGDSSYTCAEEDQTAGSVKPDAATSGPSRAPQSANPDPSASGWRLPYAVTLQMRSTGGDAQLKDQNGMPILSAEKMASYRSKKLIRDGMGNPLLLTRQSYKNPFKAVIEAFHPSDMDYTSPIYIVQAKISLVSHKLESRFAQPNGSTSRMSLKIGAWSRNGEICADGAVVATIRERRLYQAAWFDVANDKELQVNAGVDLLQTFLLCLVYEDARQKESKQ